MRKLLLVLLLALLLAVLFMAGLLVVNLAAPDPVAVIGGADGPTSVLVSRKNEIQTARRLCFSSGGYFGL